MPADLHESGPEALREFAELVWLGEHDSREAARDDVAASGSRSRLNELELICDGARGYETIFVTDETDPYVEH